MKYKVYVDGQHGTTGLEIHKRLKSHKEIEFLNIEYDKRRDINARKKLLNTADIVFLCLPDEAAREAVSLITNPNVRVIDASVAHRVENNWVYGIPEMKKNQRNIIKNAKRVSVAGCHATGFVLSVFPLVNGGVIPTDYPVVFQSITGYSGGGKKMINEYKENISNERFKAPRPYALTLNHKHIPEMKKYTGLDYEPVFTPVVSSFYKGLAVSIPLVKRLLLKNYTPENIASFLQEYYHDEKFVSVKPYNESSDMKYFDVTACNNTNKLDIFVFGNKDNILIMARLDNLGKGASGAAVQNMNIMLGIEETEGLKLY